MPYHREIIKDGHPTLRKVAKKVDPEELKDPLIQQLIDDMFATMYAAPGIGLAAPQVNISKRIFITDLSVQDEEIGEKLVFVNPRFTLVEEELEAVEGCLSVPGKVGDITRYGHVVCAALDRHGKRFEVDGRKLFGRCLQHEMDHLNGVLYIDKAKNVRDALKAEEEEASEIEGESIADDDEALSA